MKKLVLALAILVLLVVQSSTCLGAGVLDVEIVNGYNLVVDSNITAPSTYGPKSAYIGARICNTGDAALANVFAYVGDYGGLGAGLFPVWTAPNPDPVHPVLSNTGDYSLTIEAGATGAADGTRYIGTLAAGECRIQYWLISYPQCVNVGGVPQSPPCSVSITGGIKPDDDLSLDYDVWATTTTAIAAPTVSKTRSFTLRNEISAAANKIWPNTTAKVPDEYLTAIQSVIGWGTLGPDGQPLTPSTAVYPGQRLITTQGIWYDLGNVGQGFDNDGNLIPDQNAWLQPVGDPGSFDADCFRMVNVYGIVIVKLKTGGELLIPFQNELYHEHIPDNTGVVGLVYYQFVATDGACSAKMTPYQEAASGYDNEKFSADYGLALDLQSQSFGAAFSFSKTDGLVSVSSGNTPTYTATATNSTGFNLGAPDLGLPLVFRDTIPAGTTFFPGSADDSPATNLTEPSGTGTYQQGFTDEDGNLDTCTINYNITGSSFVILYSTDNGTTWSTIEPGSGVTDLQWLLFTTIALDGSHDGMDCVAPNGAYNDGTLLTSLPEGKSASIKYRVTVTATAGPIICNTASAGFGGASSSTTAQDCDLMTGNNSLSGTVFKDDGVGASTIFGNGTKETNEGVIGPGVVVSLYYDRNGDGKYDSNDLLYGSTTTNASGAYSFSSLPDGPYLVVVKKYDGTPAGDGTNNAVNDSAFGTTGWGNTTFDPNLPLSTDQGILKLNEDLTTVTLAANIDLDKNNATGQNLTNVNFGFAPPFRLSKTVASASVDEGDVFTYTILLENRLPNAGMQGPTGCQYTVWAPTGVNGTPATKEFTNPANAWDVHSPNRTVASAVVSNGGLRYIYGTGFNIADQKGLITKVEGLFYGYFNTTLTDDFLNLTDRFGGNTVTGTINTAQIDSYVGPPAKLDPDSAISWELTRPGGGSWTWADDFSTVQLEINPTKTAAADAKVFYLDAIGLRITTNADCVSGPSTILSPVPLQDRFDSTSFTFVSSTPAPTSVSGGTIKWDDVGPIPAGSSKTVIVTVRANDVNATLTGTCATTSAPSNPPPAGSACNLAETAFDSKHVYYADGRLANDYDAKVPINIVGKAELRGTVWSDTNNDGWPNNDGESGLPNVTVTLFACVQANGTTLEPNSGNKTCAAETGGNFWKIMATATTDTSGNYEFIGLDTGNYIVEVGDTDGIPAGANTSPYGSSQTAEPNDTQAAAGGNATGTNGVCAGGCDNTWGNPANNLNTMNQLGAATEETINGVNFGYHITNAALYGHVWYDINGNAAVDLEDAGLPGFTVQIYSDPNADGNPADGALQATTTTDANGNYSFSGLAAASYVIVVSPPLRLTHAWVETHETTGGTGSLNDQIPVTLTAGQFSGSHNFGYMNFSTSNIGDTVYLDFNGNGVQDATEAGIPDVTVWLYKDIDRDGTIDAGVDYLVDTDVTDASGKYLFLNVATGSYVVKVDTSTLPASVTATDDPDLHSASIGDRIFFDANGNGVDNSEDGIPGVYVRLYLDVNNNGVLDDPIVAATITNVNGNYLFTGLNTGNYFVTVHPDSLPMSGLTLTTAAAFTPGVTLIPLTNGASSTSYLTADMGYSPSTNYAIGNRVWNDDNLNNVQDPGEVGIGGVDIWVRSGTAGDACYAIAPALPPAACRATTSAGGFWLVTGLTNGRTYSVEVDSADLPRSYTLTAGTNPRNVTIAAADNMGVDFGYSYTGAGSTPTGTISGSVFLDINGDKIKDAGEGRSGITVNLLDADYNILSATSTAADGTYLFTGVFIGQYFVQAVDTMGTLYSVLFLDASQAMTNINIIYNQTVENTADSQSAVSVFGTHDDLNQDFGYQHFKGSIGDTVYQDVNENATQDLGEPGLAGVTVQLHLWKDAVADGGDGDGVVDAGELELLQTTITTADDPLTAADEGGKYLFTDLPYPPANQYYFVRVDTTTLPGTTYTLIADPDTDGVSCISIPAPGGCDNEQAILSFTAGINYLGADFGYRITGSGFGKIGDHLWLDTDGDGVLDSGELGVRFITVWLDTDNDGVLDWADGNSNGQWDSGEGEQWVQTDSDGYYVFTDMADGTYNLKVLTTDPDWPAGLPTTPTFEAGTASFNNAVQVRITSGAVDQIDGGSCSNCDLNIDFGYRYTGANTLSGTICVDDSGKNGFCGATSTTYSGVWSGNEAALAGVQVFLYKWGDTDTDNTAWNSSTGVLDAGDTFILLGSATTDANGDYSFSNVPSGKVVAVLSVSETQNLRLTTTNANSSVEGAASLQLFESTTTYGGNTVTVVARQALNLTGNTLDLDFAFDGTLGGAIANDFGDLPAGYGATLLADGGAQHRTGSLYLGTGVSSEVDGIPSADAIGEADMANEGVTLVGNHLTAGPSGGSVQVTASAAGWLAGWIDFNNDGNFTGNGELIINGPVAAGTQTVTFDVPYEINGGVSGTNLTYFARFRIYPAQPLMVSPIGTALDSNFLPTAGEVEDYKWTVGVTLVTISDFRAYEADGRVVVEWTTESETGTAGFYLYRMDETTGKYHRLNEALLPGLITEPQGGTYRLVDEGAAAGQSYVYLLEEIEAKGSRNLHGPYETGPEAGQTKRTLQKPDLDTAAEGSVLTTDSAGVQTFTITGNGAVTPAAREDGISGYIRGPHPRIARGGVKLAKTDSSLNATNAQTTGSLIRITVSEDGLYSLDARTIGSLLGLGVKDVMTMIANRTINLSTGGQSVSYVAMTGNNGIRFYGKKIVNNYSDESVYLLKPNLNGQKMGTIGIASSVPVSGGSFTETKHYEKNAYAYTTVFTDPEADYWFWDYVVAGNAGLGKKSFTLNAPGAAAGSGTATLTVRLQGATDSLTGIDHHAVVSLNGTILGEGSWAGTTDNTLVLSFSQNILIEGDNTVEIQGKLDSGVPYSIFFLNNIDLQYQREYTAENDRLEFRGEMNRAVTVSGFSSPEISLYNVTDPMKPIYVNGGKVSGSNGSYSLSFVPKGSNSRYLSVAQSGIIQAAATPVARETLRSKTNRADYLVITTEALREEADRLASYRQAQRLKTMTVLVGQIMDEFGFGSYNPNAIRTFLSYAKKNWTVPPKYVLLAGSGNYDYKENMALGGNLVPVLMVGTPEGLYPSDTRYADTDGDKVPDLFIGRLPASDAAMMKTLVDKIIAYENAPAGPWTKTVVMAADDADKAGDFPSDRDSVAALLPAVYTAQKVTVGEKPLSEVRTQLFGWLQTGVGMLNYIGHGAVDRMAQEGLLKTGDVATMTNTVQPFMTGMTCVIGNYGIPGVEALSEALLLKQGGGAIAVWSPTGMSINDEAIALDKRLILKMYGQGGLQRVGEIVTGVIRDYARGNGVKSMIDIYNLLGDPALILKK